MSKWNKIYNFKDAIEGGTAIVIIWRVTDIYKRAESFKMQITFECAKKILLELERNYNHESGISWPDIDVLLRRYNNQQ